ncbi:MAG TPA: wax ester/triacylglycerol synthase family O-acyltransferase [Baekduia sp.]|nr:wax ester/triacylglycerol synthase family O-acyltransferase [Baekduia sp.]
MERLTALDTTFLQVEDDVSHMHLGSVGLFEGPAPPQDAVVRAVEAKLHLAPRYRQRVRFVPLGAGRPVWVDDPGFRAEDHLRRAALPAPGGDAELHRLVGRVMSRQLDRTRPLWQLWIVEGLADGSWAMISKLHHAMVDGVAANSLVTLLMDPRADTPAGDPVPWTPEPDPAGVELVAGALAERASRPAHRVRAAAGGLRQPRRWVRYGAGAIRGLAAYTGAVPPPPSSSLNGRIGRHRRWDRARTTLADVREIRAAFGGTVNDVLLTAVAQGFRELLQARGEATDRPVRALIPVSVRRPSDPAAHNRVSAIFADLPVGVADPVQRLRTVTAQLRHLKQLGEPVAGEMLTALEGFTPEILLAAAARMATRTPQRSVNTVVTNVPGPQAPLHLAGRRMLESYPYVPIAGHVRIGVAIYSYDGGLGFGITADDDAVPDLEVLRAGIEHGVADLLAAARGQRGPAPPAARAAARDR